MGKRILPELYKIDGNHPITEETDRQFLQLLSRSLLLALKDRGQLNAVQYDHAEKRLFSK